LARTSSRAARLSASMSESTRVFNFIGSLPGFPFSF
jgi:hypothetical protein